MAEPAQRLDDVTEPDVSHLVTEDDTPVDNPFQDSQMRLLTRTLYASWPFPERQFVVFSDVGLRAGVEEHAVVPDVMLVLDVGRPPGEWWEKRNRSYFVWRYGKPPDVALEIVSASGGGEDEKLDRYASIGVGYVAIYDPRGFLTGRPLRGYRLRRKTFVDVTRPRRSWPPSLRRENEALWLPEVGLGLTVWHGMFETETEDWLRWCDREGNLLLTGQERAGQERARAEQERARADQERARAEQERARAEKLAARLREMGLDPS